MFLKDSVIPCHALSIHRMAGYSVGWFWVWNLLQFCFPLKTVLIGYENLYRIPPGVILMLNVQFSIVKIHIILLRMGVR